MGRDKTRTSRILGGGVVAAWTVLAWYPVAFFAGWTGSISDVLSNQNGDHLWATLAVWLVALSPSIGWWMLLKGKFNNF